MNVGPCIWMVKIDNARNQKFAFEVGRYNIISICD
jgi:hypothetical protein